MSIQLAGRNRIDSVINQINDPTATKVINPLTAIPGTDYSMEIILTLMRILKMDIVDDKLDAHCLVSFRVI